MAGSYQHCEKQDGTYAGPDSCENIGDCWEAIEHMFFMINWLSRQQDGLVTLAPQAKITRASEAYFRCVRREDSWPPYMNMRATS